MKKFLLLVLVFICMFSCAGALDEDEMEDYIVQFISEDTYSLPDDEEYYYFYSCEIDNLIIGKNCRGMDFDHCTIRNFEVSPDHPDWVSVDGVVFTKDRKTLLYYPVGRDEAHYDVPVGTEVIGSFAFVDAVNLRSVSLPFGLKAVEQHAFARSGVESMVFPFTMESIGERAFNSCVLLEQVSIPACVAVGEYAFYNCPKLPGGEIEADLYPDDYGYWGVEMLASPKNVNDLVKVYDAPNGKRVLTSYVCGETIWDIYAYDENWYLVKNAGPSNKDGYVRRDEVTPMIKNTLFDVADVRVKSGKVMMYDWGVDSYVKFKSYDKTLAFVIQMCEEDGLIIDECTVYGFLDDLPGWGINRFAPSDEDYFDYDFYYYFPLTDAIVTRKYTGDEKTFGMVVASEPQNRVKLRAKPSQNADIIDKYFSGTQLEILETQKDWYKVRIGFQEGYMMKEFVMIVEQEEK